MSWRIARIFTYILAFAFAYALFENYGRPCSIVPWCGYDWLGLAFYQYGFMLPLFTVVALGPFLKEVPWSKVADLRAFGSFLLAVLGEDSVYFVLHRSTISPGTYTTQWGYFEFQGLAIPFWYFFFATGVIVSFYWAERFESQSDKQLLERRHQLQPPTIIMDRKASDLDGALESNNKGRAA